MFIPALPVRNPGLCDIRGEQIFSDAECDEIRRSGERQGWREGKVGTYGPGTVASAVRNVLEQTLPLDPTSGLPLSRIVAEISRMNSLLWYFDLTGIVPDDPAMLLSYRGASGDHYDWHIDIGGGCTASRKLGFTVQLSASSEYVGGDLEFRTIAGDREAFRRKGLMLVFPAYWLHRVTPVTKGNRQVIVGWIHGPSFR